MSDNNPDGGLSVDTLVLEEKLAKIRLQIKSNLDNQKHLAIILAAVEENIDEQHNERSPVSYFVSFLSLLDQCMREDEIIDQTLATSTAYFLDIIFPFTPKSLLKSKFGEILVKLAPGLSHSDAEAPLIRSTVGALQSLLLAQDHKQWSSGNTSPKRAFLGLLELSFDPRPKVRKRAQEAVSVILSNPPASPLPTHVAAPVACDISLNKLTSLITDSKKQKNNKDLVSQTIHCLQLIGCITSANAWPSNKIEPLADALLEISKTSDQFLVSSAFTAFEGLFKSMSNEIDIDKFTNALNIIFDLKPSINDTHLAASWLAVVAKALEGYSSLSQEDCIRKLNTTIPIVSEFLGSDSKNIYISASQCLIAIISQTIPDNYLLQPSQTNGITGEIYELMDEFVTFIAEFIEKELFSIKYQAATKEILEFVNTCIIKFRSRCNPDFLSVLEIVGQWRTNEAENFAYNKEAEDVISSSISSMGPQAVLSVLPLNLTGGSQPGRAWLLPLLRDNVRFADLKFFKTDILPSAEFFEKKIAESSNKESMNNKIFQTIIDQIWSLLPHFCDLPKDLRVAFDEEFATYLSNLMYSNVGLRGTICHGLRLLVESNLAYSEGVLADDLLMQEEFAVSEAKSNLEYLASIASNLLSVLFNVFSSTAPDSRHFVLETIDAYLQIIPKDDLENTFNKVCGLLKNAMEEEAGSTKKDDNNLSVTMMDLVVAMAKYVPESSHNALFSIFSMTVALKDNSLMQKRSYRIISKMAETDFGKASIVKFIGEVERVLLETTQITHNSARAARLTTVLLVLDLLPPSDLYFIPAVLQEIIMSTKDVNEKSRELAYQILIKMGKKMSEGGIVENGKVPGFDPSTPTSEASLTEFFTMVSAGLAADTPHMISATITAVSCLVYEYKDQLPTEVLLELASTIELYLTHNSREIAKSAIGFVKVEILSLPEEIVRTNLKELLSKLMRWSHEHKGHFKSKVKHILERLIRRFGIEEIESAMPEEDKKLIVNIRKSTNRAKRKQQEAAAGGSEATGERKFVSAYEEALYDSDESEDEEEHDSRKGKRTDDQYIIETGDEPMNLLDRQTLAQISSSKPKKFGKKDIAKSDFKTKNGKIVFNENEDEEDPINTQGSGIDAYLDAVKQAPVRGQRNKLKFKKTKEDDWSDNEDEPERPSKQRPLTKSKNSKISKPKQKFKARRKL